MANWRFGAFPKLPYSTMQQLNLDWILDRIRRFLPDTGTKGQVLTRTKDGAAWQDVSAVAGSVNSVNGKTGDVVLTASDVGALPSSYQAPVTSVNGMTGDVVIQAGGGAVDSVNGQTGDVVLDAEDVGALPDSYTAPVSSVNGQRGAVQLIIPDSTSDLTNDSGFITAAQAAAAAPVQSVNGQTGAVVISTIKLVEIPQSVFAWNSGTSSFYCSNIYSAVPELTSIPVGFFVFFTNGSAISGTRLQGNSLYVMGWIPNSAQSISSGYTFTCFAILSE